MVPSWSSGQFLTTSVPVWAAAELATPFGGMVLDRNQGFVFNFPYEQKTHAT